MIVTKPEMHKKPSTKNVYNALHIRDSTIVIQQRRQTSQLSVFVGLHQSIHVISRLYFFSFCILAFRRASAHPSHSTQLASAFMLCSLTFPKPLVPHLSVQHIRFGMLYSTPNLR